MKMTIFPFQAIFCVLGVLVIPYIVTRTALFGGEYDDYSLMEDGSNDDYEYTLMEDIESKERNNVLHDAGDAWGRFYGGHCTSNEHCTNVIATCWDKTIQECRPVIWFWLILAIALVLLTVCIVCCIIHWLSDCITSCCCRCCRCK